MRAAVAAFIILLLGLTGAFARAGPTEAARTTTVLDLGDSLALGTAPYLRSKLRGYRIEQHHDVGLHAYDVANFVRARAASLPRILIVSAGTNDDPRIVSTFWRSVRRVVAAAGPRRCVVWPTIVRPPAVGTSYDGLNRVLTRLARRHRTLVVVDWVGMVRRHPSWLAADGVHVNAAGYRARAAAIAAAVRIHCPR